MCLSGSLSLSVCFFALLFFTFYLLKTKKSSCQISVGRICVGRGSVGAGRSQRLMSLGGEALAGADGGSTTQHALMGLLMLKHDQNKQSKSCKTKLLFLFVSLLVCFLSSTSFSPAVCSSRKQPLGIGICWAWSMCVLHLF